MEKYPEHPGWKDTDTSRQAAINFKNKAPSLREQVMSLVLDSGAEGVTADETASILKRIIGSIRPRFSELKTMGMIEDSGRRRDSDYGNNQIVWIRRRHG